MMISTKFIVAAVGGLAAFALVSSAQAVTQFDQNVTNNAIFGGGNINGSYTTDRANGVELGLRGKLRFDAANQPQNIFNSNGDGTYTFNAGVAPGGFGFAPNSPTTPVWNFEWSINSNFDGTSGENLDGLVYEIGIDFDPGPGTNFLTFDPIIQPFADHSIGDNTTAQSAGVEATDAPSYAALILNNNLAQNSWNMEFFNDAPFDTFDPTVPGVYDFYIEAQTQPGAPLARVDAQIIVVPEPASLALLGLGGLAMLRRR
jgi:PEP-CTERM motif-containing protein